ncbi:MAG TPA: fibronectin type III domain-containing protein, partial [Solirubrobacteraceae bacterium]|nr:fibronectin type III domain-containing protein [Solirubrobacteraceae bacterium]
MESALSRLPLGFAVVCLLVYVLGATYAAAAFAQEGAPQATLSSLTATGSTITVTGFVVPGGSVTSFVIDYGTTSSSLGQSTSPVSIGSLPQPIPVNQTLSGLTAGTTYYVQIVATSSAGTGSSAVMSATTSGSAPAAPSPTGVQLSASALPHLGLEQDQLAGVSCVSGSFCFAVGQGGSHLKSSGGVAERFNGRSWSGLAGRLGGSESSLESVSCLSSSFCIAVGHTKNGTLAERFNGRFWSRVESVSPAGPGADALNSVSCISRRDCWAAGYIHGGLNTPAGSLVEHYDGHAFTVTSTPRDRGYLTSVSCATSAYCWAVGDHGADHYDGHAWKPVSLPGSLSSHLSTAVSCRSVSACWIVGASAPGGS